MNKLIRFNNIRNSKTYDLSIDPRLSLKANLELLKEISDFNENDYYIYDLEKNIFLNKDVPFCEFNLDKYKTLYIYPL